MAEFGGRKPEREDDGGGSFRRLFIVYMVFLWLGGLGCLAIGLWMNSDPYVRAYFTILRLSATDTTLFSVGVLLLVCGLFVVGLGVLGCCGVIKRNRLMLFGFIIIMVIIMVMELTVGFLAVVFKDDVHRSLKQGMKESISEGYEFNNHLGRGWNFVQVREKCCGADEAYDYRESKWEVAVNTDGTSKRKYVPVSCCVLQFDQDRDPSRVDPQDPRPRDRQRCQDAAQARRGDEFLHKRGCFARLLDFIEKHFNTLIGLGLSVGFFQILGLVLGILLYRTMDDSKL